MRTMSAPEAMNEARDYEHPVPFSRGTRVDLPGFSLLFISGTASVGANGESLHEGDFPAQARRMFANVTALLRSEGAGWRSVVKTTFFLKDMGDYQVFARMRMELLREEGVEAFPSSTCVQATLCRPELLCEMEAIALLER